MRFRLNLIKTSSKAVICDGFARNACCQSAHLLLRLTFALLCFGALPNLAHAAAVACAPQTGYTNCLRYTYSGASQAFVVPAGVTQIKTTLWGAGGGGSMPASGNSAGGAAGGFAEGVATVTPSSSLTITSGQAGIATGTTRTYGQGGAGGPGRNRDPLANPQSNGSSGGGMSGVWSGAEFVVGNALIVAGGGGGSAFWTDQPAASRPVAGAGGGLNGVNGTSSFSGLGGTQVAGGAAGLPVASCSPAAGSSAGLQLRGGDGCWPTVAGGIPFQYEGGGGGGGGWFGGGGGVAQNSNNPVAPTSGYAGPGGGGSGYLSALVAGGVLTAGAAPTYTVGSTALPPQTAHVLYIAGIGRGGAAETTQNAVAGNGEVIIQWSQPIIRLQKVLPGGRAVAADQFTLIISGANGPASVLTTGSGTTATGIATLSGGTAGTSYTLSEAGASGASLANYTTTYACTNALAGGQTPSGTGTNFNITPVAGDNLTCTLTNTLKLANITLRKTWVDAVPNDAVTVAATGLTSLLSVANTANETDTGAVQTVPVASVLTLSELFTTGTAANYNSALVCTGTSGLVGNTLTVGNADTTIVCTYTNRSSLAALTISKTDNKTTTVSGDVNIYTITVGNNGPAAANGAVVVDPVAPGLSCTAISCAAAGGATCPAAPTVAAFQNPGLTIPSLPNGGIVTFTLTCNVTATGV